jgi:prepilin-type N-terminal cleavage/methylation domain-containing protein
MKTTQINKSNAAGFTLLEVLIALVVLAVGILGVATMQISSIQGNSKGRQISEATSLASALMEDLLAREYNNACLIDRNADEDAGLDNGWAARDLPDPDAAGPCPDVPVPVPQRYNLFWNIAEDWPDDGTKTIRIFVEGPQIQTFSIDMIKADI